MKILHTMKHTLTLLTVLFAAAILPVWAAGSADAVKRSVPAYYPPFSWEKPPRNFHSQNADGEFSDEQIAFIAANYSLVCIEKAHGMNKYGESQTAFTMDAKRIHEKNPKIKVLFYMNATLAYHNFKETAELKQHPEWLVSNAQGRPITKLEKFGKEGGPGYLDLREPEVRSWLTDIAARMCASGGADGLFLDAVGNPEESYLSKRLSKSENKKMGEGMISLLEEFRKKIGPDKLIISHCVHDEVTPTIARYIDMSDGVYIETFLGAPHRNKEVTAAQISMIARIGKMGKIVIAKGWPEDFTICRQQYPKKSQEEKETLARKGVTYPLACFLMGAQDYAYFPYSWWYYHADGWFLDYPELRAPLGRPLGDYTRNGWKYRREFEHATVTVDVEKKTAVITPKK